MTDFTTTLQNMNACPVTDEKTIADLQHRNELLEAVAEAAEHAVIALGKRQDDILNNEYWEMRNALDKLKETGGSAANRQECVYCYGTGRVWNDRPKEWEQCAVCLGSGAADNGPTDYTHYSLDEGL